MISSSVVSPKSYTVILLTVECLTKWAMLVHMSGFTYAYLMQNGWNPPSLPPLLPDAKIWNELYATEVVFYAALCTIYPPLVNPLSLFPLLAPPSSGNTWSQDFQTFFNQVTSGSSYQSYPHPARSGPQWCSAGVRLHDQPLVFSLCRRSHDRTGAPLVMQGRVGCSSYTTAKYELSVKLAEEPPAY